MANLGLITRVGSFGVYSTLGTLQNTTEVWPVTVKVVSDFQERYPVSFMPLVPYWHAVLFRSGFSMTL